MFLEMQAQLAKSWLELAERNMRAASDLYANANRDTANFWLGAFGGRAAAQPLSPFGWAFNPLAMPAGFSAPFAVTPWWVPAPSWPAAAIANAWMAPFSGFRSSQPTPGLSMLTDAMAASYRTAGGHAAATVLMPFVGTSAKRHFWEWPQPQFRMFW